ncbi:MAG: helix-turn-helix domain-containing protein [Micrococcales bacterium]|nr:helix-turn-helix domain-containing protein [Micrococcales bacterium]
MIWPEYMSIATAAKYLDVSRQTVERLMRRGGLKGHRVGRVWRIRKVALDQYMNRIVVD